jgi:hypothetical protein
MKLSKALWAHRISRHGATKVTPFELVYGQEAVLPIKVNLDAYRLAKQNDLSVVAYHELMMDNIDEVTDIRLKALKEIEKDKARVTKAYNKKVKSKSFQMGELVWKTMHTFYWIEEQSVWQVVTKLGGSLQSDQSHTR